MIRYICLICIMLATLQSQGQTREEEPSPTSTGTIAGKRVVVPKVAKMQRQDPTDLKVGSYEIQVLREGTEIGNPGDFLITLTGEGFLFTENNPVLTIGESTFGDTYHNERATELYVIIPAQELKTFREILRGQEMRVVNPNKKEAALKLQQEDVDNKLKSPRQVSLRYTKFAVERTRE